MPNIAALGIQVDSSQAKSASTTLTELSSASGTVSKSLQTQYDRTQMASKAFESYNNIVKAGVSNTNAAGKAANDLAQQQLELTKVMKAQNDNFAVANDNIKKQIEAQGSHRRSVIETVEEGIKLALHLKTLAALAYLFVPAFRAMADAGAARMFGEINNQTKELPDRFNQIRESGKLALEAFKVSHPETFIVLEKSANAAKTAIQGLLVFLLRIAAPILILVAVYETLKSSIEQANEVIEKHKKLLSDANSADVGVAWLQRMTKGAEALGITAESALKSFKKFAEETEPKLGGSEVSKRLKELTDAGNFKGNAGVQMFKDAKDTEERYAAIVTLITKAMDAGQRLAALDIAEKAGFSDEVIDKLKAYPHILEDMYNQAKKLKDTDIIDPEVIAKTIELEDRLKKAKAALAEVNIPFPSLLKMGQTFKEIWVEIVELIATVATKLGNLKAPDWLQRLSATADSRNASVMGALRSTGVFLFGEPKAQPTFNDRFGSSNGSLIFDQPKPTAAQLMQSDLLNKRRQEGLRDTSVNPESAGKEADQFTRLYESIKKSQAAREADIATVGLGIQAHDEMRAKLMLEEAARQVTGGNIDAYREKINKLAKEMGLLGKAFEEAKIKQDIAFGRDTAFFTPEDVQIASQLKTLYGNVADAMNSVYAQQLRINQQISTLANLGRDTLQSFASDVVNGLRQGENAFVAFQKAAINALNKISDKLMQMIIDQLWSKAFGGGKGFGLGSFLGGGGEEFSQPGVFNSLDAIAGTPASFGLAKGGVMSGSGIGAFSGNVISHPTIFPFARGIGLMGEAGPEAVMPLKRGSDGKLGVSGSGGMKVIINNSNSDSTRVTARQEEGPEGQALIVSVMKKAAANGELDAANQGLYGIRRRKVR